MYMKEVLKFDVKQVLFTFFYLVTWCRSCRYWPVFCITPLFLIWGLLSEVIAAVRSKCEYYSIYYYQFMYFFIFLLPENPWLFTNYIQKYTHYSDWFSSANRLFYYFLFLNYSYYKSTVIPLLKLCSCTLHSDSSCRCDNLIIGVSGSWSWWRLTTCLIFVMIGAVALVKWACNATSPCCRQISVTKFKCQGSSQTMHIFTLLYNVTKYNATTNLPYKMANGNYCRCNDVTVTPISSAYFIASDGPTWLLFYTNRTALYHHFHTWSAASEQ